MDKIDFKKLYKDLYNPKEIPSIIHVPAMNFIMVDGHGNPNDEDGEYKEAVGLLYALSFTLKMGLKTGTIKSDTRDYIDYVIPPLEGLWWLEDTKDMDFTQKNKYCWTSMIRQPDFITEVLFDKAKEEVKKKKPDLDVTKARFVSFEEGLCVQCMHLGPYDNEPSTIAKIDTYIKDNDLAYDIGSKLPSGAIRHHHEIYLSDPRKTAPSKLRTILRHPVKKV